jgi:hypothetical protein
MGTSTSTLAKLTEKETELLLDLLMYSAQTDTENSKSFFTIANKIDEMVVELGYAEPDETETAEPETEME